jgi:hypothetical protein
VDTVERFWSKVKVREPDECWLWTGPPDKLGFGRFKVDGVSKRAHQVAWELANGPLPDGRIFINHVDRCRNRLCVNVRHMWLGLGGDAAQIETPEYEKKDLGDIAVTVTLEDS